MQSRHSTCAQTYLAQTEPTASISGSSAATSRQCDAKQLSISSSSSSSTSSSDDDDIAYKSATTGNACVLPHFAPVPAAAAAGAAAGNNMPSSPCAEGTAGTAGTVSSSHDGRIRSACESGGVDSGSSAGDCDSHGSSESDSDSDSLDADDNSGRCSDTPTGVLGNGSQQQTAFDQLDMLFSRKGAAGSMSTQLAALDLLKQKPGQSRHSVAQSVGGKTQLCKGAARLPADKGSAKTGLPKQRLLGGEDGGKASAKTEWMQMQIGGNPVYSNQKAGRASAGEC